MSLCGIVRHYVFIGECGSLVVEARSGARGRGFDTYFRRVVSLSKDTFTPRKGLVIPRKRWLRPDMIEKMFTGMLSHNKTKPNYVVNPLAMEGLSHPYYLDESTFIFRGIGSIFSLHISMKIM